MGIMTANHIDALEVLYYLNELGYKNISQLQLKEFLKDLKKLIKYETTQAQKNKKFKNLQQLQRPLQIELKKEKNCLNVEAIESICGDNHTLPTKMCDTIAKHRKNSDYKIGIKCNKVDKHYICDSYRQQNDFENFPDLKLSLGKKSERKSDEIKVKYFNKMFTNSGSSSCISNICTYEKLSSNVVNSSRSQNDGCERNNLRPKSSFIRPNITTKSSKFDPVARYHFYQQEWSKVKLPGENHHLNLRWAIREKLLGSPSLNTVRNFSQ